MKECFFCGGSLERGVTSYMAEIDGQYIIIKDVPCEKCAQCGEEVFSDETVKRIEKMVSELKKSTTEVAIARYAA